MVRKTVLGWIFFESKLKSIVVSRFHIKVDLDILPLQLYDVFLAS